MKSPNNNLNYWGTSTEDEYYRDHGIKCTKSFHTSTTKQTLFTRSWAPLYDPPRGIICMVHGYGGDISWNFQSTPIFLAQNGYACFALDLLGHGLSPGLKGFVPNIDRVVDDCISYFNSVIHLPDHERLPAFLYGESMGGALCLLISMKINTSNNENGNDNNVFKGAILVAPMCRISDNLRPKWPIPEILIFVAKFMPKLAIVPSPDVLEISIKVLEKKRVALMNPLRYNGRPRLGTILELVRVTDYLSANLKDVTIPFIVLHGSSDVVTDPNVSRALYEEASSEDKTLKIYEGMCHSLVFGETDENVELVRNDLLAWLSFRCDKESV
ncbi:hypothetical protein vseg_009127 [Gypsophila vaccaria]